jgi:hypothetical protein
MIMMNLYQGPLKLSDSVMKDASRITGNQKPKKGAKQHTRASRTTVLITSLSNSSLPINNFDLEFLAIPC